MFSKILSTFGARALAAVINLLIAVVLSQFLGPEGKGIQSLILTTITFILVFANLVGGATLVYLVPRHNPSLLLLPSYLWTIIVSVASYFILTLFPLVDSSFTLHICLLSVINSIGAINTSILVGKEKIGASNVISLSQPVTLVLGLLVFFTMSDGPTVNHYLWSLYISMGLSTILSFIYYARYCGRISIHGLPEYRKVSAEMVRFGILNQVAHITQMLSFRLSYYVLGHFHGESAVGVYSNGISLAESIWLIAKSISLVQYARISNTDDRQQAASLTTRLIKFSVFASLLILIPLIALPASFYSFIFGEGFADTRMVIWTLSVGVLVYNFSILTGHYFSGTGRYHINAITSTIGLAVSIALYFIMIPRFGLVGAGWATSISYVFTSVILMVIFSKEYKGWKKDLIPTKGDLQRMIREIKGMIGK